MLIPSQVPKIQKPFHVPKIHLPSINERDQSTRSSSIQPGIECDEFDKSPIFYLLPRLSAYPTRSILSKRLFLQILNITSKLHPFIRYCTLPTIVQSVYEVVVGNEVTTVVVECAGSSPDSGKFAPREYLPLQVSRVCSEYLDMATNRYPP